jgi:hypothetical protein
VLAAQAVAAQVLKLIQRRAEFLELPIQAVAVAVQDQHQQRQGVTGVQVLSFWLTQILLQI